MADPNRKIVRERLAGYFGSNGTKDDAAKYFHDFEYAVRALGKFMPNGKYQPLGNTIEDGKILFHYTPTNFVFAASYLFPYRNITFCITVPQGLTSDYPLLAMDFIRGLSLMKNHCLIILATFTGMELIGLRTEKSLSQSSRPACPRNTLWPQ
jgi:hypothetical protein